jgi:uncharacterized protein (TIGR02996 family)
MSGLQEERARIVGEDFVPYVKSVFEKHGELRSALLTVAQYWADEADDAVHATIVFSTRATPLWPHWCSWGDDDEDTSTSLDPAEQCSSCGDYGWMPFDDNGSAIGPFQSCCREDASQDSPTAEAYLPYAVARRRGSEIDVEIVGGPVRAWLDAPETPSRTASRADDAKTRALFDLVYAAPADDGPRQVLADWLVEKDDPLGAFITTSFAAAHAPNRDELLARARELEKTHAGSWLGPLADVAPRERASFARGFPHAIAIHVGDDDAVARVADAREWGTIAELRFLPQSKQWLSSAMGALRDVGPLDATGLTALRRVGPKLAIERAHVVVANEAMLGELASLHVPSLRGLTIGSTHGGPGTVTRRGRNPFTGEEVELRADSPAGVRLDPELLAPLRRSPSYARLDELVLASTVPQTVTAWLALPPAERPRTIAFTSVSPSFEPAGFRVRVTGDVATVDLPALGGDLGVTGLAEILSALPSKTRIELRPSRWFDPTDADAALLANAASRTIAVARAP